MPSLFAKRSSEPEDRSPFEDHLKFAQLSARRFDLTDVIDDDLADRFRRWTDAMAADSNDPIEIVVNSPGGSVTAGFSIISQLRRLQRQGIVVVGLVVGDAASMAAVIAAACDRCVMTSLSRLMWHGIQGGTRGDLSDIDDQKREMERMGEKLATILTARAKEGTQYADPAWVAQVMREKKPVWIWADEAFEAGLCDEVVE